MPLPKRKNRTALVVVLFLILLVLHQDFWFWSNETLLFGFMPVGLGYHAIYSVCCAMLGAFAIRFAWPVKEEEETPNLPRGGTGG